ncbi:MAG: ankyrin repeat domain-containing protein [Oligoflexia bacterium]|nr:ankyrin repeat domain-containing protein [Oligoflexia bacterium]
MQKLIVNKLHSLFLILTILLLFQVSIVNAEIRSNILKIIEQYGPSDTKMKLSHLNIQDDELPEILIKIANEMKIGGKLANLTELDLSNNKLTALPAEIKNLPNLKHFYFDHNPLATLLAEIDKAQDLESVKKLIEIKKMDVNTKGSNGLTFLHNATLRGQTDIINFLLSAGANIDAKTDDGKTPLALALKTNNLDITTLFVQRGAKISDYLKTKYQSFLSKVPKKYQPSKEAMRFADLYILNKERRDALTKYEEVRKNPLTPKEELDFWDQHSTEKQRAQIKATDELGVPFMSDDLQIIREFKTISDVECACYYRNPKFYKEKNRPVLIYTHGNDANYKLDLNRFDPIVDYYVAQGYIVVAPNYRQHKEIDDIYNVGRAVRTTEFQGSNVDPDQVFLYGISAGSGINFQMLEKIGKEKLVNPFAAVQLFSTVAQYDFKDRVGNLPKNIPYLIIHGEKDDIAPVKRMQEVHDKMKEQGFNVQAHFSPSGNHHLVDPKIYIDTKKDDPLYLDLVKWPEHFISFFKKARKVDHRDENARAIDTGFQRLMLKSTTSNTNIKDKDIDIEFIPSLKYLSLFNNSGTTTTSTDMDKMLEDYFNLLRKIEPQSWGRYNDLYEKIKSDSKIKKQIENILLQEKEYYSHTYGCDFNLLYGVDVVDVVDVVDTKEYPVLIESDGKDGLSYTYKYKSKKIKITEQDDVSKIKKILQERKVKANNSNDLTTNEQLALCEIISGRGGEILPHKDHKNDVVTYHGVEGKAGGLYDLYNYIESVRQNESISNNNFRGDSILHNFSSKNKKPIETLAQVANESQNVLDNKNALNTDKMFAKETLSLNPTLFSGDVPFSNSLYLWSNSTAGATEINLHDILEKYLSKFCLSKERVREYEALIADPTNANNGRMYQFFSNAKEFDKISMLTEPIGAKLPFNLTVSEYQRMLREEPEKLKKIFEEYSGKYNNPGSWDIFRSNDSKDKDRLFSIAQIRITASKYTKVLSSKIYPRDEDAFNQFQQKLKKMVLEDAGKFKSGSNCDGKKEEEEEMCKAKSKSKKSIQNFSTLLNKILTDPSLFGKREDLTKELHRLVLQGDVQKIKEFMGNSNNVTLLGNIEEINFRNGINLSQLILQEYSGEQNSKKQKEIFEAFDLLPPPPTLPLFSFEKLKGNNLNNNLDNSIDNILALGGHHSCIVKNDGTVVCWGDNDDNQSTPPSGLKDVKSIALGIFHSCALKNDGTVVFWGDNFYNQSNPPSGLKDVKSIALGNYHSCALKNDGTVVCWGHNNNNQSNPPSDLKDVKSIALGREHSCAVKNDGTVVCWGDNSHNNQSTPPVGLKDVKSIALGFGRSCAVKNDGTVVCWGANNQSIPPSDLKDVKSIALGYSHSCALKNDGTVVCWGNNTKNQSTPPSDLKDVRSIALGGFHSCAVKNDGTVVCWGNNTKNQSTPPPNLR